MKLTSTIAQLRLLAKRFFFRLQARQKGKSYLRTHSVAKLQVGCGRFPLQGWLNGDNFSCYHEYTKNKIYLDACKRFPFPNNSFDYIFSEHLIEHLPYQQAQKFLEESHRVLRPGGKIRVATPNLDFLISLYDYQRSEVEESYLAWANASFSHSVKKAHPTFVINNFFYSWGHSFIFCPETLSELIRQSGFASIQFYPVGQSDDAHLSNLEQHGKEMPEEYNILETMCIEATKPI